MSQNPPINLNQTWGDRSTDLVKGYLGMIPVVGPIVAELVVNVIPHRRIERITQFLTLLGEQLQLLDMHFQDSQLKNEKSVAILEEAMNQAARSTSQERIEQLAKIVATGFSKEQMDHVETELILQIFGQLKDIQIVLLRGELPFFREQFESDQSFLNEHKDVLEIQEEFTCSKTITTENDVVVGYRRGLLNSSLLEETHALNAIEFGKSPKLCYFHRGYSRSNFAFVTPLGVKFLRYLKLLPAWYEE